MGLELCEIGRAASEERDLLRFFKPSAATVSEIPSGWGGGSVSKTGMAAASVALAESLGFFGKGGSVDKSNLETFTHRGLKSIEKLIYSFYFIVQGPIL